MLFGVPVFDVSRILVIGVKMVVFVSFVTYFYSHVDVVSVALYNIAEYVKSLVGSVSSLDLGCFMNGVGGVDFLNSLINQFIFIATFVLSTVASILSYRMIIHFFSLLMKF